MRSGSTSSASTVFPIWACAIIIQLSSHGRVDCPALSVFGTGVGIHVVWSWLPSVFSVWDRSWYSYGLQLTAQRFQCLGQELVVIWSWVDCPAVSIVCERSWIVIIQLFSFWSGGYFSAISVYAIRGYVVILFQLLSYVVRRLLFCHFSVCDKRLCGYSFSATQLCGQEATFLPFQCMR